MLRRTIKGSRHNALNAEDLERMGMASLGRPSARTAAARRRGTVEHRHRGQRRLPDDDLAWLRRSPAGKRAAPRTVTECDATPRTGLAAPRYPDDASVDGDAAGDQRPPRLTGCRAAGEPDRYRCAAARRLKLRCLRTDFRSARRCHSSRRTVLPWRMRCVVVCGGRPLMRQSARSGEDQPSASGISTRSLPLPTLRRFSARTPTSPVRRRCVPPPGYACDPSTSQ